MSGGERKVGCCDKKWGLVQCVEQILERKRERERESVCEGDGGGEESFCEEKWLMDM